MIYRVCKNIKYIIHILKHIGRLKEKNTDFCFDHFLDSETSWKLVRYTFQQSSLYRIQKLQYSYSWIKIGKAIGKNAVRILNLKRWVLRFQSIRGRNFDPKREKFLFLSFAEDPLLRNVQKYLPMWNGSLEIWKTKVRIKMIETSFFTILNMLFSLHFCY